MKTCWNCGRDFCGWRGIDEGGPGECAKWRPLVWQRVAGIIVLALMLLGLALIVVSAMTTQVMTGLPPWAPENLVERQPTEVLAFPRAIAADVGWYLQQTGTRTWCEVGLEQEARWYDYGRAHAVPTVWYRMTGNRGLDDYVLRLEEKLIVAKALVGEKAVGE